MIAWQSYLEWTFYNNNAATWLTAAGVALTMMLVLWLFQRLVLQQITKFTAVTRIKADNYLAQSFGHTKFSIVFLLSLYIGSLFLELPAVVDTWIGAAAVILLLLQVAIWGSAFINIWQQDFADGHLEEQAARVTTMRAVGFIAKFVLFSILLLIALDNIPGVEVTTLIASLGIGGVAVALAVQNVLGDLFASLSISLDKPFVIGDFIVVGDFAGQVEQIGLKTTRVRSISGEQIIFSNSDLLSSRVRNFKRMKERRVVFSFGVTYETSADKLEEIPEIVRDVVENQEQTRFDRAHFKSFGASSLDYEVVYHVLDSDYDLYMNIQQAVNLALFRLFADEGIEFAYPTQTLYLNNHNSADKSERRAEREEAYMA